MKNAVNAGIIEGAANTMPIDEVAKTNYYLSCLYNYSYNN